MQYNGIELKEITESQVFDPPKEMLVWDDENSSPDILRVYAIGPSSMTFRVRTISDSGRSENVTYQHCADIPEEPKPRMATNRELAKWLAQGNGQISRVEDGVMFTSSSWEYHREDDSFVKKEYRIRVRKWEDTEWHELTADYLGLE